MIWDLATIIKNNDKASEDYTIEWRKAFSETATKYVRLHIAARMLLDLVKADAKRDDPLFQQVEAELEELLLKENTSDVD
jgi:hypothetical protein